MARPRVRWTRDPNERPEPGEVLARLWHTRRERVTRQYSERRQVRGTRFAGYRISVETYDGRKLEADVPGSESGRAAPLIESDADPELVDLLNLAWRQRPTPGRPRGLTTIESDDQIRDVIRDMRKVGRRVTQANVAVNGEWTLSALRGYLRVKRKDWKRDFLDIK